MNKGLRDYLKSIGAKPVDPKVLAEYERGMREDVIPKIMADQRQQARLRRCLRYHPRGCRCAYQDETQDALHPKGQTYAR